MIRLNIGCGPNLFSDWTNLDRVDMTSYIHTLQVSVIGEEWPERQRKVAHWAKENRLVFSQHDLREGFYQYLNDSVDAIYLGQMIEHLNPIYEAPKLLKECHRMLKPGGVIRITTPDLDKLIDMYLDKRLDEFSSEMPDFYRGKSSSTQLSYLMFGSAGPQCTWDNYEGHFHMYDEDQMADLLGECGFRVPCEVHGTARIEYPVTFKAQQSNHPAMTDFHDEGMSYAFAMEAYK